MTTRNREIVTINHQPTIDDACGSYKFIDVQGRYWGHWYVGVNWAGQKFVAEADPRDGVPW